LGGTAARILSLVRGSNDKTARCSRHLAAIVCGVCVTAPFAQVPDDALETIEVVGATPLGAALDLEKVAARVQTATAEELREQRALQLSDYINRNFGSVFVNEAQNNPLQPDVQYRGYVGSPLLGLPQGIAVYQDGVRLNEPFGDTVNWALIPDSAIDSLYLMPGSNPLFGLNALGGAISIRTKNGFTHPGTSVEASAGSFSRLGLELQTGAAASDTLAYFVTASRLEEDGWRDYSPTDATQLFSSLRWESERSSIDASLTYADTELIGNGAAPIQLLELRRDAIFTRPDRTRNELALINLSGSHRPSEQLTITGNAYFRDSDIDTYNGDDSDFEACEDTPGFVCEEEDGEETLIEDQDGEPIAADDAVIGATVNRTGTAQESAGLGIQASWSAPLGGRDNLFVVGLAHDGSEIAFDAGTELGRLDETRAAVPSGFFDGESFTRLDADVSNTSVFISNVTDLTPRVSLSLSGRYNKTEIDLRDRLGTALDGEHSFERFNPAAGLTLAFSDELSAYAGYAESNRAPSPVELTCADENAPCRLPNAFLADPPLADVVAKTFEAGVRGSWNGGNWHAGIFRATNENDILFISAGALTNEGYFDNVGRTRREGVELSVDGRAGERLSWFTSFTSLRATFRESFAVSSENNPEAVDGEIFVEPGDRLPLIPERLFKAGLRLAATSSLVFGADVLASGDSYFRGDEGNVAEPLDGYTTVNLRAEYALGDTLRIFFTIANALDAEYETFGVFGEADEVLGDEFEDGRFLSPGAPRAAWLGFRGEF
jgi:outer membrane receptor protein involved in Fe transport